MLTAPHTVGSCGGLPASAAHRDRRLRRMIRAEID